MVSRRTNDAILQALLRRRNGSGSARGFAASCSDVQPLPPSRIPLAIAEGEGSLTGGYSHAAGDGERVWIVGDTMTFKAAGENAGGQLVFLATLTAPGGGPPPHVHTREDEFFYVLDGTFEIRIGDELHTLQPGGFAFVPRGTVHNFRNTTKTPARILVGFTPGGIERFFRESGRPATDDRPAPTVDDDEISRTMAGADKYGLQSVSFDA
jgi:quercetin dioxygenase-like cupin family protein